VDANRFEVFVVVIALICFVTFIDGPMIALLDQLGGAGEGRALLRRLRESEQPPQLVAQSTAASPAFEQMYKHANWRNRR
jgi:hypothetical protein